MAAVERHRLGALLRLPDPRTARLTHDEHPRQDYTHRTWLAAAALLAVLVAVSFIPRRASGVKLRRANILSDLVTFDVRPKRPRRRAGALRRGGVPYRHGRRRRTHRGGHHPRARFPSATNGASRRNSPLRTREPDSARWGRDPDTDRGFQRQRTHPGLLRHAADGPAPGSHRLPGDSFVEGDILTADLRERLQSALGLRAAARDSPRWPRR